MSPREARQKLGLTQAEVCRRIGHPHQSSYSRIETGQQMASPADAEKIIELFAGLVTWEEMFSPSARAEWIARLAAETVTEPVGPGESS